MSRPSKDVCGTRTNDVTLKISNRKGFNRDGPN